ncbi:MAG TPA: hypothetical protein VFI38_19025 [Candidatus Acidoferrum sp.]|nr:hypothetical protein [Candidatus Acidoferrum sp.]
MKKLLTFALLAAGCGSSYSPPPPTQVTPNASITGQYNLVLTSTNGRGTTNIYTNFTQNGTALTGEATTLVCPANDLSTCQGDNPPLVSISPAGTVHGANVSIVISFPASAGPDTITLVGTAKGPDLSGTYTDNLGDTGIWTASAALLFNGTYSGTYNSTSNPLPITPSISISLLKAANLNLTGTATITSSPCISSLTFTGRAVGGAFTLTDAANKASFIALPSGNDYKFNYTFDPTAAHCAGDSGRGVVTNASPWDY